MPNIIADEMRRQARREMKGDIMALKSGYTALRRKVAENSKRLACLEKDVKKLQSEQEKDQSRDEKSAQRKYRIGSMTLKRIRGKGGFTQNDLATVLGVSLTSINRWERGKMLPNYKTMEKIAILRGASRRELKRLLAEKPEVSEG